MKNDVSLYDKKYFEERQEYMTDPYRFHVYASIVKDLGAKRVLDIGCGINYLVDILRKLDIEAYGMDFSKDGGADVICSAPHLPVKDGSFDLVISTDLLEHLEEEDVHRSIREFDRVAPMQAHFICFKEWHGYTDDDYHVTLRDQAWWMKAFQDAGMNFHSYYVAHRWRRDIDSGQKFVSVIFVFDRISACLKHSML